MKIGYYILGGALLIWAGLALMRYYQRKALNKPTAYDYNAWQAQGDTAGLYGLLPTGAAQTITPTTNTATGQQTGLNAYAWNTAPTYTL